MYGQSFLCISLSTGDSAEKIGLQMLYNHPYVYSVNIPKWVSYDQTSFLIPDICNQDKVDIFVAVQGTRKLNFSRSVRLYYNYKLMYLYKYVPTTKELCKK